MKKILLLCYVLLVSLLLSAQCEPGTTYSATAKVTQTPLLEGIPSPKAVFSVSAMKYIYFSKGNLQFQASTNTWRFAEQQYEYIGAGGNNTVLSSSSSLWLDMYCYGTGANPLSNTGNTSSYASFVDWGINPISNGGNTANLWRTISKDELQYILSDREDAYSKRGFATVNDVAGLLLLPDIWAIPNGLTFIPTIENYTTNVYSFGQWLQMENNGAVFLPLARARGIGSTVVWAPPSASWDCSCTDYWTSTPYGTDEAYILSFNATSFGEPKNNHISRAYGFVVRLVADKQ